MNIDYEQLKEDKATIHAYLPCTAADDSADAAWDAWDRICMILEELEKDRHAPFSS